MVIMVLMAWVVVMMYIVNAGDAGVLEGGGDEADDGDDDAADDWRRRRRRTTTTMTMMTTMILVAATMTLAHVGADDDNRSHFDLKREPLQLTSFPT